MLSITPKAREMLDSFAEQADGGELSLRVEIIGRGPKGFQYDLQFVTADGGSTDDFYTQREFSTIRLFSERIEHFARLRGNR
jgi:Fe-S cluster assembly iron-binding protein IscA